MVHEAQEAADMLVVEAFDTERILTAMPSVSTSAETFFVGFQ